MNDFTEYLKKLTGLVDPKITEKMASEVIEVKSGGGFITVKINHLLEVVDIRIDDSIFVKNDKILLERLLVETFNSAIEKIKMGQMQNFGDIFKKLLDKDKK